MKRRLLMSLVVLYPFLSSKPQNPLPPTTPAALKTDIIKKTSASLPSSATGDWMSAAQEQIADLEYHFKPFDGVYGAANRKQRLGFAVSATVMTSRPIRFGTQQDQFWQSSITLKTIGRGGSNGFSATPQASAGNKRLAYNFGDVVVEYLNSEAGLRQNFIVKQRPEGDQSLRVKLGIEGDLVPAMKNNTLQLLAGTKTILEYDGLKVWDANGKILDAHMELSGDRDLLLIVNDEQATYPVTIDPLTHASEWATTAVGLLPGLLTNLQLQVDALYAYSIAGVGDVNGDGYDDVAIGAPGTIDVIAGPTTVAGAGAVFVYFGSATGLSTTPQRTLRASTAITNALFGFSIAGGNVTGDSKKDIVVGAPGESYSTAVSGIPSTATVTAGKVYVFNGSDLAAGSTTPLASLFLNGSAFFSNGVIGVLLANVGVNALFGFSVAVTEDMASDGLGEIIVGSPGYQGVQLLDVRSGAAFVYYSSNIGSNTPVKLTAPTLLGFPGLVNIDGLLFGFSVDGAGDYNKDTRPDVVVGAPGGLNLGLSGFLGGSAYVYTGNGAGVNTAITTQLTASGPLLGSVANLFGYCVRGVKNVSGSRTGNILVGAPVGSVLSDVLGGLQLKTGNLNVFPAKVSPAANEVPAQSFTSPRASSLLAILNLQTLNVSAMFGASIDNAFDANCDGIADIIVGEPLSTGVGLIGANAVGGSAFIFTGTAGGTYNTTPYWSLENTVSLDLGINAGSLVGFSVAGVGHIRGPLKSSRVLVGGPGKALDFGTGLLNLGNTLGTLFSFTAGNNGLGKAYAFGFGCDVVMNPDINVTHINVPVNGNVNTNDAFPGGMSYSYSTPVANPGNPAGATINMNSDGTYTFTATTAGVYLYEVPVCITGIGCTNIQLKITVLDPGSKQKPPVANTDIAVTNSNTAVVINSLYNDASGNTGGSLNPGSVTVTTAPAHGTTSVNSLTGAITYTPANGFEGMDTLTYTVCDNTQPVAFCSNAQQIITVRPPAFANTTEADDDHVNLAPNTSASGNVKTNDVDPEGNTQTIIAQNTTIPGKGTFVLNTDGSYTFTPVTNFTGPVSFVYTTCDNGTPQVCANATVYFAVTPVTNPDLTPTSRIANGTFIRSAATTRNFVIEVNEIWGNTIDNNAVPVTVELSKSADFNYVFNPAATTTTVPASITINNPDWDLIVNDATHMVFRLKTGANISPYNTSRIGLSMQVSAGAAIGTQNAVITLDNGSGTELVYNNNQVVRILNIVQ